MPKPALHLTPIEGLFAVCRLPKETGIPAQALRGAFWSLTRTDEELSLVCPAGLAPEGAAIEAGWRCLKVEGPFEFSEVGIIASLVEPLARAGIAVFVVSTYDTDYLLLKQEPYDRAVEAISAAGHQVS